MSEDQHRRLSIQLNPMKLQHSDQGSSQAHVVAVSNQHSYNIESTGIVHRSTDLNCHQSSSPITVSDQKSRIYNHCVGPDLDSEPTHTSPAPTTPRLSRSTSYNSRLLNSHCYPTTPTRTPTRSTYLEQVSPLRFPGYPQTTPRRDIILQQQLSSFRTIMENTVHDIGDDLNISYYGDTDPSMNDALYGHEGYTINRNSSTTADVGMGFAPHLNVRGEERVARQVSSLNELLDRQQTLGQQNGSPDDFSGSGSISRMSSTPGMSLRPTQAPEPGNGAVHIPSHPAAMPAPDPILSEPASPARDEVGQFLQTLKVMILQAVQIHRYKNGLFVTSITARTDLVSDLNILCNSTQVMGLDNLRLCNIRADVDEINRKVATDERFLKNNQDVQLHITDLYGHNIRELNDILLSKDTIEHARWVKYYCGGIDPRNNDENNYANNNFNNHANSNGIASN